MMKKKGAIRFFLALLLCLGAWAWLGRSHPLPEVALDKVDCVSYTPFRGHETPFDEHFIAPYKNIREDLTKLKGLTDCVRIYAVDQGLDQVLPIARELRMRVLMGIWIGREARKNEAQLSAAIQLAKGYSDTIRAIIVGNEVLLRGEQLPENLIAMIKKVKGETHLPVTYADVWEYWLRAPDIAAAVDFLTIHILPYWEDDPIPASRGVAHVKKVIAHVKQAYPGKDIFIGETGYPSRGRAREDAVPSLHDQALYLRAFIRYAGESAIGYNLIEAFDQPWKRASEGTVGGYWGLFDHQRLVKFDLYGPVSDHPSWRWMALASFILAAMLIYGRQMAGWLAGCLAILLVLQVEHSFTAWRNWLELIVEIYLLVQSLGLLFLTPPIAAKEKSYWSIVLVPGNLPFLYLSSLMGAGIISLGLVFDPRYRDFPLAAFAIPALLFFFLRPKVAEDIYIRWIILACGLYIAIAENIGDALNAYALAWSALMLIIAWPAPPPEMQNRLIARLARTTRLCS